MAFNESLHKRGTGAQGGQFVASDGTKSSAIGYDGTRGSGYGSKGGDSNVKALQKELNRLGLGDASGKSLVVDGKFGPRTTAATKRLQHKLGLPADGKITPALLKRIKGLKKSVSYKDSAPKKKAAPARKAAPGKKAAPPPPKQVRPPARKVAAGKTLASTPREKK